MDIGAPQLIYLALMAASLGMELAKQGEPKTGTHSFWWGCVSSSIIVTILWWGGFFG